MVCGMDSDKTVKWRLQALLLESIRLRQVKLPPMYWHTVFVCHHIMRYDIWLIDIDRPCNETLTIRGHWSYSKQCGTSFAGNPKTYTKGIITIHFQSDGTAPGRGFLLTYFLRDRVLYRK